MSESTTTLSLHDKVTVLRSGRLFEDSSYPPEVIETHISVLFRTKQHVYKLKKDVNLGFLDFSTLDRRKSACQAEIDVNRRLAPHTYEGLVSLTLDDHGGLSLGGPGRVVDWLVKMKRLPDERCLDRNLHHALKEALKADASTEEQQPLQSVIDLLTQFYQSLVPIAPKNYIAGFRSHINDNTDAINSEQNELPTQTTNLVSSLQRWFVFQHANTLQQRVDAGYVVEGHGDLRAEHIYLTQPPTIIDGVEFDRDLRIVDVADELSFLAVTCQFEDAAEVGQEILTRVCANLNDTPADSLLNFYRAYRATVRVKVAILRSQQSEGDERRKAISEAERYLGIATELAERLGPLPAIIIRGRSGTGKSTLARAIADEVVAQHIATDHVRRTISFHDLPNVYSDSARNAVYTEAIDQAVQHWQQGRLVILDGTFLKQNWLEEAYQSLAETGARVFIFTCECPDSVAMERVRHRAVRGNSESEADERVLQQQTDSVTEPPTGCTSFRIDTTQDVSHQLAQIQMLLSGT
ncbi:bifunctional aminoglycoside phosphotransferase/ATP-binding protein [Rhodopirellula halodulae]|uniref:bifunctional aminoglycoside phosphotransferase/ATP-binding protein n=1 Tax=Rhodopirellula halodulae TaxID=2894198 RepID=UPI001E4DBEFC|nr:bifunctional aminoglycoside phosphotransferase/ATP-binding protein [Rhodopirellula sp. JC737]MCC9655885.1 AAA family ATPase [Rhodopirellula sp. JC737]